MRPPRSSQGGKEFTPSQLVRIGQGAVIEPSVLIFHPETVEIGADVYVGRQTILKGHPARRIRIGDGTWTGQQCLLHSAGNIEISCDVGFAPGVRILSSAHSLDLVDRPILHSPIEFRPVYIGDGGDVETGAILLPGARVWARAQQVGAGTVVTADVPDFAIVAGVPARVIGSRK